MQRYTKNSTSAANRNQCINISIDSAKQDKKISSFAKLIFFIDVTKKSDYIKLEDKIKSVGGTVRLFLNDDVTHFVTDKANDIQNANSLNGSSPRPSLNCSIPRTPKTPESAELKPNKIITSRTRSRVDEMIHRARLETSISQPSLLDVALLKNIRIWEFNFANLYLNKILKKIKLHKTNIKKEYSGRIFLTEPFIKIEDNSNKYRPYYKIFKCKWPFVNLINCELDNLKTSKQDVINPNKIKTIKETDNKIDKFGYCEICKCEYDVLSVHLKTEQHFSFASDQKNYEALDKLIDEKISIKYFLEENFSELTTDQNNQVNLNMTKLQYHDYFSRSTNDSEKGICVQGKINRVTRQGQLNLETKANGCKKKRNEIIKTNKNSSDNHIKSENHYNYISDVRKNDKETQDYNNKTKDNSSLYYKVIKSQSDMVDDINNKRSDKDVAKPAIIVKFRKIRQSELSILNGEAENFMFPKTKNDSESSRKSCSEQKPNKRKYSNIFSPDGKNNEKIKNNTELKKRSSTSEVKTRNKEINKTDYLKNFKNLNYSFECIPSTEPWYNVFCRQDSGNEHTYQYFGGTDYKKLPYEMGHVPIVQTKPYLNYCMLCKSKDQLNEQEPNILSHQFIKKENDAEVILENYSSEFKEKYNNCNNNKQLVNLKIQTNQQYQIEQQQLDLQQQNAKSLKKFYLTNLEMPRKSPREHASTLAMLSCLVKKSTSCQNSINNDSKEPTPEPLNRIISTPSIENDQDNKFDFKEHRKKKDGRETDSKIDKYLKRRSKSFYNDRIQKMSSVALEKEIDYFLQKSYSDCLVYNNPLSNKFSNSIEVKSGDDDEVNVENLKIEQNFENNVNLNDIMEQSMKEDLSYNRPLVLNDGLKNNSSQKKRPVNKTGWPYKKKLLTRRQKGCISGFHHHKGVLVKKSSPWSYVNNNLISSNDVKNELETDIQDNDPTNSLSSNLNDSIDVKNDKLKNVINSFRIVGENTRNRQQQNLGIKIENDEDPPPSNVNSKISIVPPPVPTTILLINETKLRTQLRSPQQPQNINKNNSNSIATSPRVLRKPRGRWYRER